MDNYQYCAKWAIGQGAGARVLDYGCGAGELVKLLRDDGVDAWGCDVFFEGGDSSALIPDVVRDRMKRIEGDRVPFPDESFDIVINNQVMEHVPDLSLVLDEIDRVLRSGGTVLSLFPDRGVWREGHCGVPFLHWFAKGSRARVYYAWALRSIGAGYHKGRKTSWRWSVEFCDWLDNWTYYRPFKEIKRDFAARFQLRFIERDWFDQRIPLLSSALPAAAKTLIVRKLAGLVFEGRKSSRPRPGC